ncbi:hypothetical protein SEVIR_1G315101v4 [Setaria viridis]
MRICDMSISTCPCLQYTDGSNVSLDTHCYVVMHLAIPTRREVREAAGTCPRPHAQDMHVFRSSQVHYASDGRSISCQHAARRSKQLIPHVLVPFPIPRDPDR